MKIFASTEYQDLGKRICNELDIELGALRIDKFSDGEFSPQYLESIRGHQVFLIGSTSNNIMEFLLMIDAAKRASASEIIVICPYMGYSRQDKKEGLRGGIGAKLVADLLQVAGADQFIGIDLHAEQIQGFFSIPVDHLAGYNIFVGPLRIKMFDDKSNWLICAPDAGGFHRASKFAQKLNIPIVAINKVREKANEIKSMELVGDVTGKRVIIVDDMVDTAGTLCKAAAYLKEKGAIEVIAVCTHPILSGVALGNINVSSLSTVFVSDTKEYKIPVVGLNAKIKVVSCDVLLAKAIDAITTHKSLDTINI